MTVTFTVLGRPAPQGSKTIMRGRLVESSKYLPAWRKAVAEAAAEVQAETGWYSEEALEMQVTFIIEKPKTVKRKYPTVPPDTDKLARSIGDSCTGILYNDDAQIIKLVLLKEYGPEPGAVVTISEYND